MASQAGAARTPLESVFSYIPQTHEKAVKQAFYNIAAVIFVLLLGGVSFATYNVFNPFVKPLLWAVLLGTVLHPVKYRCTIITHQWLRDLETSSTPLFISVLLLPLQAFDSATDAIGNAAVRHIRALLAFVLGIAAVNVLWFYTPSVITGLVWLVSHGLIGNLLWLLTSIFYNKLLCWTLLLGYVVAVVFFWSPVTRRFAVPAWLLLLGFLSGLAGSLAGPIFIALVALLTVGFITEVCARMKREGNAGINVSLSRTIQAVVYDQPTIYQQSSVEELTEDDSCGDTTREVSPGGARLLPPDDASATSLPSAIGVSPGTQPAAGAAEVTEPVTPHDPAAETRAAAQLTQKVMTSTPVTRARPRTLQGADDRGGGPVTGQGGEEAEDSSVIKPLLRRQEHQEGIPTVPAAAAAAVAERVTERGDQPHHSLSTTYITAVAYACVVVIVWQRIWLVSMLPVVIVYYFIKRLTVNFWRSGGRDSMKSVVETVGSWLEERQEGIMPLPIRGAWKLILQGNASLIASVQGSADAVVTVLVVLGVLVFLTIATVFASVQIYGETVHMVELTGNLINSTIVANPDLQALLPGNMSQMVEQMLDNGYLYGRDYISKLVRDLVKDSSSQSAAQLERQTLDLWDRLYQNWVTSVIAQPAIGPVVDADSVSSAWQLWLERVHNSADLLQMDTLQETVKSNLGTLLAVLESSWTIVRGNLTMLLSVVTTLISVLLGGGFAVLNSVINTIVFVTALFYLLSCSGRLYKPVELLARLGPVSQGSSRFVLAVDEAVSGVFVASFKMAMFYFLWTWLVHSVFGVKFVYLPSVVAAVLGAVPFLGSYWAALPAVLELWLVHARPYTALAFFGAQLAPILFVDTAIYSEIKGGHPYLTGLAIAGGIFCQGIEGAIFGPVLLCCLLVAVNMFSTFVNSPEDDRKFMGLGRLKRMGTIW